MFNKSFTLFGLRLLNDGMVMQPGEQVQSDENSEDDEVDFDSYYDVERSETHPLKAKGRAVGVPSVLIRHLALSRANCL